MVRSRNTEHVLGPDPLKPMCNMIDMWRLNTNVRSVSSVSRVRTLSLNYYAVILFVGVVAHLCRSAGSKD